LREQTGVSILECKKAIAEANNDFEKAAELLRKKGFERQNPKLHGPPIKEPSVPISIPITESAYCWNWDAKPISSPGMKISSNCKKISPCRSRP